MLSVRENGQSARIRRRTVLSETPTAENCYRIMSETSTDGGVRSCVNCGGPKVDLLPKDHEMDECVDCQYGRPKTKIITAGYLCDECKTAYRGPKFARQCCSVDVDSDRS